jgi:hypothetical protein
VPTGGAVTGAASPDRQENLMARTASKLVLMGGGIVIGVVVALLFGLAGGSHPLAAQDPGKGDNPQRYQISSWAYALPAGVGNSPPEVNYGAYVLDTQSGAVSLVIRDGKPKKLGSVAP